MKSEQLTKEEVLRLVAAAGREEVYNSMPEEWQGRFLRFCTGEGGERKEIFLPGYQEGIYGSAFGEKRCILQSSSGGVDA